ncbi:MAG: cyclic nucleotide-binding domain-containing protein [Chthoniobacterales bacterium]|nr:cyclic nucleotide-binding domain-containing protein [Chthoniobacterales bacterium]
MRERKLVRGPGGVNRLDQKTLLKKNPGSSIVGNMANILKFAEGQKAQKFAAGKEVIRQGEKTGCLFFLVEGAVEILRDGVSVATVSESGVIFGEMSALLDVPHTATVRTLKPSAFCIIPDALAVLQSSPEVSHAICKLLARRLNAVNKYLVETRHQLEGDDHLEFVIKTLEGLLHHQPKRDRTALSVKKMMSPAKDASGPTHNKK